MYHNTENRKNQTTDRYTDSRPKRRCISRSDVVVYSFESGELSRNASSFSLWSQFSSSCDVVGFNNGECFNKAGVHDTAVESDDRLKY